MLLVKKYPNRRLYDTQESRYITIDDLEARIRRGADVLIQDASSGQDLTQETLTQIILQRGNGRILPTSLLLRLIRLDDEHLAEFLTRYVGWALEVYVGAKQRAKALLPLNPLATAPFAATDALARMMLGASGWGAAGGAPSAAAAAPSRASTPEPGANEGEQVFAPPPPPPDLEDVVEFRAETEIERIRRELEELKKTVGAGRREMRDQRIAQEEKAAVRATKAASKAATKKTSKKR
jgi:polyhydroxyalkanoate synthesis repressor PhaR